MPTGDDAVVSTIAYPDRYIANRDSHHCNEYLLCGY